MKYTILTLFALIMCQFAIAQDKDFVTIFDGTSLDGWTASRENPDSFFLEDGKLVVKGGRAHLFYTGDVGNADFKNFELKLQVMTTENSNSGVYFHTAYQERGWPGEGFEAQVNSTHSDPKKTGSLYGIADIFVPGKEHEPFVARIADNREIFLYQEEAPSKDGEWFEYYIIVQDKKVTIQVDGKKLIEWNQPNDWSKDRRISHGTLGIQAHDPNSTTYYKDIRIKVLD